MTQPDIITLKQVKKTFGNKTALNDISLRIPKGSIYGLIGPNGAGKTTLLSLVCGYLFCDQGDIEVLGVSPKLLNTLPGQIGILPQDSDLPKSVTVKQALTLFARLSKVKTHSSNKDISQEIDRVLNIVDLGDFCHVRLSQLSHGMKKRIYIACALMGSPELIILDEPTSGLDPKHANDLCEKLKSLKSQSTIVISSHQLNELENICDHAAILLNGEVVFSGGMNEIRKTDEKIHILIAAGQKPDLEKLKISLPQTRIDFLENEDSNRNGNGNDQKITIHFLQTTTTNIEEITQLAIKQLVLQNITIKSIERGQSLLQSFLEFSDKK